MLLFLLGVWFAGALAILGGAILSYKMDEDHGDFGLWIWLRVLVTTIVMWPYYVVVGVKEYINRNDI